MRHDGFRLAASAAAPGVVFAAVLTLWNYDAKPMWRDEYFTYGTVNRGWSSMMNILDGPDVGLIGYYTVMHAWMLLGDSTALMRAPGAVATIALAAVVSVLARRLGGGAAGVAAGLLVAAMPAVVDHAQEARAYPFVLLATAVVGLLALRVIESPTRGRWAALAVVSVLPCLLHPLPGAPAVAGIFLGLLLSAGRGRGLYVLLAALPAAVASSAVVAAGFAKQTEVDPGTDSIVSGLLRFQFNYAESGPVTAVVLLACLLGAASLPGLSQQQAVLLCWCAVPVVIIAALGMTEGYFRHRYISSNVPAVAVLAALGFAAAARWVSGRTRRATLAPVLAVAAAVSLVAALLPAAIDLRQARYATDDPRTAARYLEANYRSGDAVVMSGTVARGLVDYYASAGFQYEDPLLVTSPQESGTLMGVVRSAGEQAELLEDHDRIWVVGTKARGEWPPGGVAEQAVSGRSRQAQSDSGAFVVELWVDPQD